MKHHCHVNDAPNRPNPDNPPKGQGKAPTGLCPIDHLFALNGLRRETPESALLREALGLLESAPVPLHQPESYLTWAAKRAALLSKAGEVTP